MALRAFFFTITLTKALAYYYIKLSQCHLYSIYARSLKEFAISIVALRFYIVFSHGHRCKLIWSCYYYSRDSASVWLKIMFCQFKAVNLVKITTKPSVLLILLSVGFWKAARPQQGYGKLGKQLTPRWVFATKWCRIFLRQNTWCSGERSSCMKRKGRIR